MNKSNFIITIGREFGSGGRIIGQKLAEQLNIPFYDKEIINLTAKESGFDPDIIAKSEQKKTNSFLYNLYMTATELPLTDQIQIFQSKAIKKVASEGSCVIVGRCADYILSEYDNVYNVFVSAPLAQRVERASESYNLEGNVEQYVKRKDKERESYYNSYTQNKWGHRDNYHLIIDSSVGIDKCVDIIKLLIN